MFLVSYPTKLNYDVSVLERKDEDNRDSCNTYMKSERVVPIFVECCCPLVAIQQAMLLVG